MNGSFVSDKRLEEFMQAEITHFSAGHRNPLTLETLLADARSPRDSARRVHEDLPKHFAARIRQIEEREDWQHDPELLDIHQRYSTSFRELRMVELGDDLRPFTEVVRQLKKRQREALPLISKWLRNQLPPTPQDMTALNAWLQRFLVSRVSTEMLTSQYLAIMNQLDKGTARITGIVDPTCDPEAICDGCSAAARYLCVQQTGVEPQIDIEVRSKRGGHHFSYVPIYLHYVLLEVLKNSCNATAKSILGSSVIGPEGSGVPKSRRISVVICSDDSRIAVKISDRGGGIPFEVGEHIWDYCWTSHDEATPLAGYGLGLPLSRLYANYLGGSLSIVSLPEYGVDAFLSLPRINTAE